MLFSLLLISVVVIKDCEQRNIESKNAREDRVFENIRERRRNFVVDDDEICDQAYDENEVRKEDQACGNVGFRLRLAAVSAVAF